MRKLLPLILLASLNAGCVMLYKDRVEAVWNDPNLTDKEKMEKVLEMEEKQQRLIAWSQRIGQGIQDGTSAYAESMERAQTHMERSQARWDRWEQEQQLNRIENSLKDMERQRLYGF